MAKVEVSTAWSAEERLGLITRIAGEIRQREILADSRLLDRIDRVLFLSCMPSAFLEANRGHILFGLEETQDVLQQN